ncbi:hypothetical protein, partial [Methylobacterium mesophilicum]
TLIALVQIKEPWLTHSSLTKADSIWESPQHSAREGAFRGVQAADSGAGSRSSVGPGIDAEQQRILLADQRRKFSNHHV